MVTGAPSSRRLLILLSLLWLVGVIFLANAWVIGIVLMLPGFLCLGLSLRAARRSDVGAEKAWVTCSLVPLAGLVLFAVANVHLHDFKPVGPGCDYMAQDCNTNVAAGIAHAASLIIFVAALLVTLRLLAILDESDAVTQ